MRIGTVDIHPLGIVVAILNFIAGLIAIWAGAYGIWFVLSDWSHITFTRCVVLFFCIWLGALALAMTVHRIRLWRRVLFPRP
jgi:membrane protease YdiL (CAAX protease family)